MASCGPSDSDLPSHQGISEEGEGNRGRGNSRGKGKRFHKSRNVNNQKPTENGENQRENSAILKTTAKVRGTTKRKPSHGNREKSKDSSVSSFVQAQDDGGISKRKNFASLKKSSIGFKGHNDLGENKKSTRNKNDRRASHRNDSRLNSNAHLRSNQRTDKNETGDSNPQHPFFPSVDIENRNGIVANGIYVPKRKQRLEECPQRPSFSERRRVILSGRSFHSMQTPTNYKYSYDVDYGVSNQESDHKMNTTITENFQKFSLRPHTQSSVQAGVLIEQLTEEKYECMICCEVIKCHKAVWSCKNCFHVFHLHCVKRWAISPAATIEDDRGKSRGWRCPICQFVEHNIPNAYRCFCGKVEDPKWHPRDGITPHSCGELCMKQRADKNCPHPCNQLCHPGPCPSCPVMITKKCCCGKKTMSVRCGNSSDVTCSSICGKRLNCGVHFCQEKCHPGSCEPCVVLQEQSCYCGKSTREVICGVGSPTFIDGKPRYFSCGSVCSKQLDCGNHFCQDICHDYKCTPCKLRPDVVTFCPCGKRKVDDLLHGEKRTSCLDPIPTCENVCDALLPCAQYNEIRKGSSDHRCKKLCHHGPCSVCEGDTIVKCRCRATSKKMKCADLNLSGEVFTCERKCNKKFDCGRHRCSQKCCPGGEHKCTFLCGKKLKCGKHKCMEPCHPGSCPPCLMAGFEEVFCPCGATVQEPPIPCGTPPPICHRPCSRMHSCHHEVQHNCHYEEECPPCTVLVTKWCMGRHEERRNIPCYVDNVSCGQQCGKPLKCGKHLCLKGCHLPPCLKENEKCTQLCNLPRESCGHPCGSPCHDGECPQTPCKNKVRNYCLCGRKSEDGICLKGGDKMDVAQAYQRFTTKNLAEKMKGVQDGHSVDISELLNLNEQKSQLECDDECARLQRNRQLAEALGISRSETPEVVQYSHFLEQHGRGNMKLVYFVEDALDTLIKNVSKVQSPKLTHSFAPMNRNNRRFIHELATMYRCTTISHDQEPNRNTVVTATKDSQCPRVKLSSQLQRVINPQPPPPVAVLPDSGIGNVRFIERKKSVKREHIDYFDDDF